MGYIPPSDLIEELTMVLHNNSSPLPPPPEGLTDPQQIAGAEERWQECPLKDCKRNPELLYEDFFLRGMRSNRLMCSKCAVRVEMGYMAREEVRKADDKFFQGTQIDNLKTFGVMFVASLLANIAASFVGYYIGFFVGGAIGGFAAPLARRLAGGRVTRELHYVGAAGILMGALLTMFLPLEFYDFTTLAACSVGVGLAAWGILQRKIKL
jgi:hypothetical protein